MSGEMERRRLQCELDASRTQAIRNKFGQFATPYDLALAIVEDALGRTVELPRVLEPSCGTGSFISALKSLGSYGSITGVELDDDYCSVSKKLWADDSCRIIRDDFFSFADGCDREFDLIVSNPPYSRHHHLSASQKKAYGSVTKSLSGFSLPQLAGLHAYFIISGTSLLADGGIASWLIPSEIFSVNYGRKIKDFVTSSVSVERLHFYAEDSLQFEDALVSSCVLVLRKVAPADDDVVLVTEGDFSKPSKTAKTTIGELKRLDKWQHYFKGKPNAGDAKIGDYFTVKRGLSTGGDSFFIRDRSEWHNLGVTDEWLQPILPSPRHMKFDAVASDEGGWPLCTARALLRIPHDLEVEDLPESLQNYLASCPTRVRAGYTASNRKKWFSVESREPSPVVCTYMSRSNDNPFRFIRNNSIAVATNSYLCLYPKAGVSDAEVDALCECLSAISSHDLISSGREYGGGLKKLEPRELLSVPLPLNK